MLFLCASSSSFVLLFLRAKRGERGATVRNFPSSFVLLMRSSDFPVLISLLLSILLSAPQFSDGEVFQNVGMNKNNFELF